jgi:subtilisin family serine protease
VNDVLASFSNIGRGLDVVAPGVDVLSSVPVGQGSDASVVNGGTTYKALGMEFSPHTNGVTGTLVNCGLGNPADFPAGMAGKVALIQRGTLTFADKVNNAKAAGAAAAIIYNNTAGELSGTLGAEGDYIPAVGVSDVTGATLVTAAGTSTTVVNKATDWDLFSGTSMATPHTAGTLALIWSHNPSLTNVQVESRLFSTADDLGAAGYDTSFGNGRIDADEAVGP